MPVYVFPDKSAAILALAHRIVDVAQTSIRFNNRFSLVLSGGNTPKALYQLLATAPFSNEIDWTKVYFFLGDERYVPLTDDDSNYKMIAEALFTPLNIRNEQIIKYDTSLAPPMSAISYEKNIQHFFGGEKMTFDMVLLGLGDNVHTASLFPHTNILHDQMPAVKSVFIKELNSYRLTMNAPLINQANHIAFLVSGIDKAMAVHQVIEGKIDNEKYPAQLIRPVLADWYLDEAAANFL